MKSDLKRCNEQVKRGLSQKDYSELGKYSVYKVEKEFGSWLLMKEELGIDKYNTISTEVILNDIKKASEKDNDDYLSTYDYKKHGKYSVESARRRFGSWKEVLEAADLNSEHATAREFVSKEEVIKEIKRIHEEHGEISINLFNQEAEFSSMVVYKFDNSWNEMVEEAGIEVEYSTSFISKEEIIDEVKEKVDYCGKSLLFNRVQDLSVSVQLIQRRFGTLEKMFKEAGVWVEEDKILEMAAKQTEDIFDQGFYKRIEVRKKINENTEAVFGNGQLKTTKLLQKKQNMGQIKFRSDKAGGKIYIDRGRYDDKESYLQHLMDKFSKLNEKLDEEYQIENFEDWKKLIGRGCSPKGSFAAITYLENDELTQKEVASKLDCTKQTIRSNMKKYENLE